MSNRQGAAMKLFSMDAEAALLCDTLVCRAEVRTLSMGERLGGAATPPVETVLCVVEGALTVEGVETQFPLGAMQGVQIPAGQAWVASTGTTGAKVLQVASFHPHFTDAEALLP